MKFFMLLCSLLTLILSANDAILAPPRNQEKPGEQSADSGKRGFYGQEVSGSKRIVFLVDLSGSMGSTTQEGVSRLHVLKRELLQAIRPSKDETPPVGAFRIIAFESDCRLYPDSGSCRFRDRRMLQKIERAINSWEPGGNTAMLRGWEQLFAFLEKTRVDTVFFLSDGEPTDCSDENLLTRLEALPQRLIVNCISVGKRSELLKEIAKRHNGRYSEAY